MILLFHHFKINITPTCTLTFNTWRTRGSLFKYSTTYKRLHLTGYCVLLPYHGHRLVNFRRLLTDID